MNDNREGISKKYGSDYITKADNNEDKFVDKNLVQFLQVTDFSEEVIKKRVNQLWAQRRSLLLKSSMRGSMNKNSQMYVSNINANRYSLQPVNRINKINQSSPVVQHKGENPQNNGSTSVQGSKTKDSSKQSQPSNSNIIPIDNKKSLEEQLNDNNYNPFDQKTYQTIHPSQFQNNQQPQQPKAEEQLNPNVNIFDQKTLETIRLTNNPQPQQPQQPKVGEQLNPNVNIFNQKTLETIHLSNNPQPQQPQQPQIGDQLNNDADIFGGKTSQTIYMGNNQANPQPQNAGLNNDIDLIGLDTLKTMNLSIANPDNKQNPFEGNINEINQFQPYPVSGRLTNMENDGIIDVFAVPAPIRDNIPIDNGVLDPFDPKNQNKIDDIFGGPTLQLEEEPINNGGANPFDPNAKVDDPFGGPTIKEGEPINNGGADPFDPNANIDDPFGGPTI